MDGGNLFQGLEQYARSGIYPYHMPGHKRRAWGRLPEELSKLDITEIDGFDNLHQPEGILLELQREAARIYGAEESFYLVNGSTCGILSAISSAVASGGHILMARNCHKSAYHAAYLRRLKVSYLYPPLLREYDIFDAIEPCQVRRALELEQDIRAVLIVSPTYEGRIADVRAIAEIVHERGIPLIVDEAHGAHLGLAEGFGPNSCQAGADLVIHSVHKTLPALTQTALLHVNGSLVDRGKLERFLHIYQSSSPSYPLMASIGNALEYAAGGGREAFEGFRKAYGAMRKRLDACRNLRFLPLSPGRQDIGKLLISVKQTAITGKQLYDILLTEYRLQAEMASTSFVLAMFTVNDGEEAYRRMTEALLEIDRRLIGSPREEGGKEGRKSRSVYVPGERRSLSIALDAAWDMPVESVALEKSIGRYMGEFINLYPPGIPLLVPGERMTEDLCEDIREALEQGLTVQGLRREQGDGSAGTFSVSVITEEATARLI